MKGSKFYKFLILGIFINLIIFTGIYFWNRGKQSIKSIIIKSYLEKLSYTEIKDGVKNWQLIADKAISCEDKILLKKVNINFFKRFRLMGNSGTFNPKTRDIRIEGQVKLWQANGYSLSTDYLVYSHHLGLIFTDAPIIIKGEDINLSSHLPFLVFYLHQISINCHFPPFDHNTSFEDDQILFLICLHRVRLNINRQICLCFRRKGNKKYQ